VKRSPGAAVAAVRANPEQDAPPAARAKPPSSAPNAYRTTIISTGTTIISTGQLSGASRPFHVKRSTAGARRPCLATPTRARGH
jgi:hypothetical protein